MFGVSLIFCGFVCLVKSQNQYQQFQSLPYGTSYASIYGNQPIILTPTNSYNQQYSYTVQPPSLYPEAPPVANQLQENYLNKILSNPAIQAFIDPGTKIYNQNGVEISDQVRPRTPNVVNNYFIVPTDYLKLNESRRHLKSTGYKDQSTYNTYPKSFATNGQVKNTRDFKSKISQQPNDKINHLKDSKQYREKIMDEKPKNLQDANVLFEDLGIINKKQRDNFKREDQTSTKQYSENSSKKRTNTNGNNERPVTKTRKQNDRQLKEEPNVTIDQDRDDEVFHISEECCDLDTRGSRDSHNEAINKNNRAKSPKNQSKNQNDIMNNWMNYVKMFMHEQNNDSHFSNKNFPYNFEQMYQTLNFKETKSQRNKSNKRQRKRKQKDPPVSEKNSITQDKNKVVELSPKFIEVGARKENAKIKGTNSIPEGQMETSKNQQKQLTRNSDIIMEEIPIYQNEILDYYPDFQNDAIYTTDEDDLYFFHNRHYYNTEDVLNRERRKFDADEDNKQSGRIKSNDYEKSNTKRKVEATEFRTPPGLSEPGFQTRKINVKDKAGFYSYYMVDKDSTDSEPLQKDDKSIETVFARSKVVKYGKVPQEVGNHIDTDKENKNERSRNLHSKKGDTTIVFSKPWKP